MKKYTLKTMITLLILLDLAATHDIILNQEPTLYQEYLAIIISLPLLFIATKIVRNS